MREYFVANISKDTNAHDLKWHFSMAGLVEKVQLFKDPYSNETKQYAIVMMWRKIQAHDVYSLLHNRKVKNNVISVLPVYRFKGFWTQGQIHLWRLFASLIRLYTHNLQVLLAT